MTTYDDHFKRNVAVGASCISSDTINFVFREEEFSVPTISTVGIATYNGTIYTAKVDKLRNIVKLMREMLDG